LLFWNEITVAAGAGPLACQRTGGNLRLDTVDFATVITEHYIPTIGLSSDPHTATVLAHDLARTLHAARDRGPTLAIGYGREEGLPRTHRTPRTRRTPARRPAQ
jgi:hypothetical protein